MHKVTALEFFDIAFAVNDGAQGRIKGAWSALLWARGPGRARLNRLAVHAHTAKF